MPTGYGDMRDRSVLWLCFMLALMGVALGMGSLGHAQDDASPEQTQMDFANGLFQRGFFAEAAEEYRVYLKQYPQGGQAALAWRRLGESEYAGKKYDAALEAFNQLAQVPNADPMVVRQGMLSKGEVLYYLKRMEEAAAVLEPLSGADLPAEIRGRALYYLGKVRYDTQQMDAALTAFDALVKELPENVLAPFARYQMAFVHLARNDYENAAVAFSEVAASQGDQALRVESRFRAAEAYDKIGWFSAAIQEYEKLKQEFPDSEYSRRASYGYAWSLYHAGKFAESAVAADAYLKDKPDDVHKAGMIYLRASAFQQQQQYDQATELYRQLQKDFPDTEFGRRAKYKLAWVLYLGGKLPEAKQEVTAFLQAPENEPMAGDAAFLLGTILVAEGNFEDAYEEFRLVAEKYPDVEFGPESLFKAGECLAQMGRKEEAAKAFESFAVKYPDHALAEQAMLRVGDAQLSSDAFAQAIEKYKQILGTAKEPAVIENTMYRMAITYHNMKDYESSAATFQKIIEQFPTSPYLAEAQLRIGDHLLRDVKDPLKAIEHFDAALAADPKGKFGGRALKGLGLARYETKDYDAASDLFLRLMTEFPENPLSEEIYIWVGQRSFDNKQWDKAAQAFKALLLALPDYPNPERVHYKVAECLEASGKAGDAMAAFQSVVKTAPASSLAVDAQYHMARMLEAQKKPDDALKMYEAAANANTGDSAARARFRLGELYEAKGEYDAAARSYMRVAILFLHEELSPEALWRAGQCFEKAGALDQARKAYQELVKDHPNGEQASRANERLAQLG